MRRMTKIGLLFLYSAWVWAVVPSLVAESPGSTGASAQQGSLKQTAAKTPDIPAFSADPQAEEQLLQLANQSRREAGAPLLTMDPGLSQAARVHAEAMLKAGQLSHQCQDEPSLPQRLAIATQLLLDEEAENVALDNDPQHGHEHLMLSPPHRANLLNAAYNVVGMGVLRAGDRLYIVEDFGHALPNYSETELKDQIAGSVNQMRRATHQPELARRDLLVADDVACSMAQADKVGTSQVRQLAQRFTVLTYTSLHPETLPSGAAHAIASRTLQRFSIGACFARTDTYPTGIYWVVLSME